jgi:hypothetical protein
MEAFEGEFNMASPRKVIANRENARRSTGPRTLASKARAAQNSMRHGLSVSLVRAPEMSSEIGRLAVALAGSRRDPGALEQARIAAEGELELQRVRAYRKFLLDEKTAEIAPPCAPGAAGENRDTSVSAKANYEQTARAVARVLPELAALERYEKRALSRRRRAMQWLMYTAVVIST